MQGHISFKIILLLPALVLFSFACVSNNLWPDVSQSSVPSGIDDAHLKEDRPLQQCRTKYILAEIEAVNLNLGKVAGDGISSLVALSNLARSFFTLGELEKTDAKKEYFEKGYYFAEILCRKYPLQVEGHYWLALNLCGLCDSNRAGYALVQIPQIVKRLEEALSIDETYDQAGPHRVLGRIRFEAPNWPISEGDLVAAVQHIRKATQIAPDNSTNHLYLAEALFDRGLRAEACRELERAISSTQHSISRCDLEEDREDAFHLMEKCNQ